MTIIAANTEIEPSIVFTHHGGDLNIDHQRAFESTLTACRPLPGSPVEKIYSFEILSNSEWTAPLQSRIFVPNHFIEITAQLDTKLAALACYKDEMRPQPHARSVDAAEVQAKLRGATIGVPYAEAYAVIRDIWKD